MDPDVTAAKDALQDARALWEVGKERVAKGGRRENDPPIGVTDWTTQSFSQVR